MTLDIDKLKQAALAGYPIHPSVVLELIERLENNAAIYHADVAGFTERLEAAEKDAAIGNWLCNYMASPNIEHDDYLIEACREDNPEKFKLAVIELMKDKP